MALIGIGFVSSGEQSESRELSQQLERLDNSHRTKTGKARIRIDALETEIGRLSRQVPIPLLDKYVRDWLDREVNKLREKATKEVALNRDLVDIAGENPGEKAKNPILVAGPGELQRKISRQFSSNLNADLNKHLTIQQAYWDNVHEEYDVLYAVLFIEFIIIATDMLVTYSFFYDFIEDKIRAEHITEQYYKDVVSLAIVKEFRKLAPIVETAEPVYIEDAPTFTLSLSSGEKLRVTFVSQDYFLKIKEKTKIDADDINKIGWIKRSENIANNAIKALRFHLRQHKII